MLVNKTLFRSSIVPGQLFYFKESRLTKTVEPHYFVVVAVNSEDIILFMVGTSKFEKVSKRIELRNQDFATLVRLKPTEKNNLTTETFINCNDYFGHSFDEFFKLYENGLATAKGNISEAELKQIADGVFKSDVLAEDIKEIIIGAINIE